MIKPKILITNDDGILSKGIYALWEAMHDLGDTFIVAPSTEKSASSHSLTLSDPLTVKVIERESGFKGWSISGTPVDCVKIAIRNILKDRPNIVISGINHGANLGSNIMYSGTVSAAIEGSFLGIPSFAISLDTFNPISSFNSPKSIIRRIINKIDLSKIPLGSILNINIPNCNVDEVKGIRITKQGNQYFKDSFEECFNPRGVPYFWMKGETIDKDRSLELDGYAVKNNYISVTPLSFKMTNNSFFDDLKKECE